MKWLYIARHGETTGDVEDRYGGDYDDDMTARGLRQAQELAAAWRDAGIERLAASSRKRAQQTAAIVATRVGLDVDVLDDWRERNRYGILTGMVKADALAAHADQVALLADVHTNVRGAEPYDAFCTRIERALQDVLAEPHERVGIITHGGPISTIVREVLGRGETKIGDCAYMILAGDSWQALHCVGGRGITFLDQKSDM